MMNDKHRTGNALFSDTDKRAYIRGTLVAVLLLLWVLTGCGNRTALQPRCEEDDTCPQGMSCVDGRCELVFGMSDLDTDTDTDSDSDSDSDTDTDTDSDTDTDTDSDTDTDTDSDTDTDTDSDTDTDTDSDTDTDTDSDTDTDT
ncbi:MAG: hypothetical protein JXX14_17390, partial [Deltaproteobacteria bacterium]|nr:hypothetical protein [Deltaproteobacteria bacterium]